MASSVCWSLQCLISALTQGGSGGHFLRLTCSVVLWGGRNTANKQHWRVLAVSQPHWAYPTHGTCALSAHTAQALGCSTGNPLRLALGCMHLPDLSCSGSGTQVVLRGADSVRPEFCALPRSKQLRCPGVCDLPPPLSLPLGFLGVQPAHFLRRMLTVQNPKKS